MCKQNSYDKGKKNKITKFKSRNCAKLKLSTKTKKPNSKTMGFIEIEDNNQNVRWPYIKQKIIKEKLKHIWVVRDPSKLWPTYDTRNHGLFD
jgi:hypothetical protein